MKSATTLEGVIGNTMAGEICMIGEVELIDSHLPHDQVLEFTYLAFCRDMS